MMHSLEAIAEEVRACRKCPLGQSRTCAVPGEGAASAAIMFIGEGPGFHEDRQGRPFVGAAGKFLDELLAGIGLKREDVYITNVVKCRPPGNRDPQPNELAACSDFLDRQIAAIQPRIIVTLGRFSMARFFTGVSISRIHGQARRLDQAMVMPMLHPAAALHQPKWRMAIEEDFQKLSALLKQLGADSRVKSQSAESEDDNLEQLRLF